jgi:menaquinone-dependent protoporphyrinogen IX oxidase
MRVLILYESRRGFTLTVARAIRDEVQLRGLLAETPPPMR